MKWEKNWGEFFPHFKHARNDIKLVKLRMEKGMRGYGVYWCLLEILTEAKNNVFPFKDLHLIAKQLNEQEAFIVSVIKHYQLFAYTQHYFYSPKLREYLESIRELKAKTENSINQQQLFPAEIFRDEDFEKLWDKYDKKTNYLEAVNAWRSLTFSEKQLALANVDKYLRSLSDKKYQLSLHKWLRFRRFNENYLKINDNMLKKFDEMPENTKFKFNSAIYTKINKNQVKDSDGNIIDVQQLFGAK